MEPAWAARPGLTSWSSTACTRTARGSVQPALGFVTTIAFSVARRNNQWAVEQVWENADIPMKLTNGVIIRDALFSLATRNSGQYVSVDAKTGKTLWMSEGRQAVNAAISTAGDVMLSLEDDGELVVVRSSQTAFEPVRRYKVADTETWAQPVISGNRIFVKDVSSLTLWTLN